MLHAGHRQHGFVYAPQSVCDVEDAILHRPLDVLAVDQKHREVELRSSDPFGARFNM
jgi:hypothetical protein